MLKNKMKNKPNFILNWTSKYEIREGELFIIIKLLKKNFLIYSNTLNK